jgi:opacity protein-like surface antigen
VGGIGLMRTELQTPGQKNDQNQIGYDLGGGLIGYFTKHVGMRGDVRYFHSFQVLDFSKFPGLSGLTNAEPKVNFGRFSLAVIFKF